jgi:hypothetical protein
MAHFDPMRYRRGLVARHAHTLGEHFTNLSHKVRQAVAAAPSETLARLAHDTVHGLLRQPTLPTSLPRRSHSYREQDPWQESDTWTEDRDRETWSRQDDNELDDPVADTPMIESNRPPSPMAVAVGLTAAGWWLRRHGTFPGALLAGFVAGVFVWLSDDGVVDSLDVVLQHL